MRIYETCYLARANVFDIIEVLYKCVRRRRHLGDVSPEAYECTSLSGRKMSSGTGVFHIHAVEPRELCLLFW